MLDALYDEVTAFAARVERGEIQPSTSNVQITVPQA